MRFHKYEQDILLIQDIHIMSLIIASGIFTQPIMYRQHAIKHLVHYLLFSPRRIIITILVLCSRDINCR